MDIIQQLLSCEQPTGLQAALETKLRELSELEQLETVTEILKASTITDEKLSELVCTAWEYLCDHDLWSYKFESLEQYRQLISYSDVIRPVIKRFKRSDRMKLASISTIEKHWQISLSQAIPQELTPRYWSKHLLHLLATLSKHKNKDETIVLLEESIRKRPKRSRQMFSLIASDVERVLRDLSIPTKKTLRSHQGSSNQTDESATEILEQTMNTPSTCPISSLLFDTELDPALSSLCLCSPICLPLSLFLDVSPTRMTTFIATDLIHWARNISWSNICLFHLRKLSSFRLGVQTGFLTRDEIIVALDEVCTVDVSPIWINDGYQPALF